MIHLKLRHISPTCPNLGRNSMVKDYNGGAPDGRLPVTRRHKDGAKLLFEVNGVGRCILRPAKSDSKTRSEICLPSLCGPQEGYRCALKPFSNRFAVA